MTASKQSQDGISVVCSAYVIRSRGSLRDMGNRGTFTITADMLHRVWDEFDYRVDVCRVTQGAHIEGL